jgi:aminoglycoside 6'-N-acetyltransferase I
MQIRRLDSSDDPEWFRMRLALWPNHSEDELRAEMNALCSNPSWAIFVADRGNAQLGAFLELGQRSVADGCSSSPVAYIEGWYVDADLRRCGVGCALVRAAEQYAQSAGLLEIASDCLVQNDTSLKAHLALGYAERNRLIHFHKSLPSKAAP